MSIESVLANEERWHVEVGDVMDGLRKCPDGILQAVMTSPPYWNLRNYGLPPSIWGGEPDCEHNWQDASWRAARWGERDDDNPGDKQTTNPGSLGHRGQVKNQPVCSKCKAWRGCLGLEPTPSMFVEHLVLVFRELRRVLRDDGTLWINVGDTYHTDSPVRASSAENFSDSWDVNQTASRGGLRKSAAKLGTIKNKDMIGIPSMLATALRDDGWHLRSTIIWSKRNGMCESLSGWRWRRCRIKVAPAVQATSGYESNNLVDDDPRKQQGPNGIGDPVNNAKWKPCPGCEKCIPNGGMVLRRGSWRPTTSHEYVFLLTKTAIYFCDGDAVKEPVTGGTHSRGRKLNPPKETSKANAGEGHGEWCKNTPDLVETRNPRSVWSFVSEPEKARHFATFPSALPRKALTAATCSAGCCPKCWSSLAPIVESERIPTRPGENTKVAGRNSRMYQRRDVQRNEPYKQERLEADRLEVGNRDPQRHIAVTRVTGYRPTCTCNAGDPVPSIVADIFSGSGTTGRVAYSMGLRYLGFELSEEYAAISREKIVRPFAKKKPVPKHKRPMDGQKPLFE